MKHLINKSNIMLATLESYDHYDVNTMSMVTLYERTRRVIHTKYSFYDLETGEEYYTIPRDEYGLINGPIFPCLYYVKTTYPINNISDEEVLKANELYDEIIAKRRSEFRAKMNRKLIKYPQTPLNHK